MKIIQSDYYIFYNLADQDNKQRIITHDGILDTIDKYDHKYKNYTYVQVKFIECELNDEILKEYLTWYKRWADECMNNDIYKIDITQGDIKATQQFYFSLVKGYKCKTSKKLLHDKIIATEYKLFERCKNNALFYLRENDITLQCWSYDRKMAYANIMNSDLKIPKKVGKEYTLTELPKWKKLKYGFYKVKITYTNKNFLKCFVLSPSNWYVDVSLRFAMEIKEQFGLTIELVQDGQMNAYLYKDEDMVTLADMNSAWITKLKALKAKFPKNPYIKNIASSTWGMINERNTLSYTADQINEKKLDYGLTDEHQYVKTGQYEKKGVMYYEMVNSNAAYGYHIRLKPWITARARVDIGRLALKHLEHVVRIQTDSISFDTNIKIDDENYPVEAKTTGFIHWKDCNAYHNQTTGYKSKNYNKRK